MTFGLVTESQNIASPTKEDADSDKMELIHEHTVGNESLTVLQ